ncbi:hypothetical protein BC941DRAFT_156520 [Chlamydoabsidia padenii]|nr:hypothetical protein BC941DRAFT_156520 [Chlamydoabsidia padenii]
MDQIDFNGTSLPNLPGCLKSGAIASTGFAVFGALADQFARLRYKTGTNKIRINTDHAGYFLSLVYFFRAKGHSEALDLIGKHVKKYTAQELEDIMVKHKLSGSICYSPEE